MFLQLGACVNSGVLGSLQSGSHILSSSLHFGLLVLQAATGIDVTHVPYKGSARLDCGISAAFGIIRFLFCARSSTG